MAGDLYRALARNQNLQPSVDAIKGIVQTNKNRELMNKLVDAKLAIEGMNATPSLNYEADPLQRYKKAGNLASSSIFDAATTGGDVNTLNLYGGLLRDQVSQMKPAETKYQQFDPYKELMRVDEYGNLSSVRDAKMKPKDAIPYSQTKQATEDKFSKELKLIAERGKEERKTAGYKNAMDKKNSNNQVEIDRSKLRGQITEGISKIKAMKQNAYNPQNIDDKGFETDNPFYQAIGEDGKKINLNSKESVTAYKEQIKSKYAKPMQELITKSGLDDAVNLVRKGISGGLSPEESLNKFIDANAGSLSKDDVQDLQNWFTLFGL